MDEGWVKEIRDGYFTSIYHGAARARALIGSKVFMLLLAGDSEITEAKHNALCLD